MELIFFRLNELIILNYFVSYYENVVKFVIIYN